MSSSTNHFPEDPQSQLFHDALNHLHAIGLVIDGLRISRDDAEQFESLCAVLKKECQEAFDVVRTLRDLTRSHQDNDRSKRSDGDD